MRGVDVGERSQENPLRRIIMYAFLSFFED